LERSLKPLYGNREAIHELLRKSKLMESLAWLQQRVLDAAQHRIPLRMRGSEARILR
jgi:hypothetical protein